MENYKVDLNEFPPSLHRIVKAWYSWQGVYLWAHGRHPGQVQRAAEKWETTEQVFWGARPPSMVSDMTLTFANPSAEMSYYLSRESNVYYIDVEERGTKQRFWMFRELADAEKYILYTLSQDARPGRYSDSPRSRWRKQGLDPRVTLSRPDPENFPGRVSLTVDHEPNDRGWMGENDAIAFSHAIILTYEELDNTLRDGIPNDIFEVRVSDG